MEGPVTCTHRTIIWANESYLSKTITGPAGPIADVREPRGDGELHCPLCGLVCTGRMENLTALFNFFRSGSFPKIVPVPDDLVRRFFDSPGMVDIADTVRIHRPDGKEPMLVDLGAIVTLVLRLDDQMRNMVPAMEQDKTNTNARFMLLERAIKRIQMFGKFLSSNNGDEDETEYKRLGSIIDKDRQGDMDSYWP